MKSGWLVPLCALVLWGLFSCKAMPKADPSGGEPYEYGDEGFGGEDFGGYGYEGWDLEEGDEDPSLALPPGFPSDAWSGDLIEPSLETGEAFLPDFPPEDAEPVLAEPLPEPAVPDLPAVPQPELAEAPPPRGAAGGGGGPAAGGEDGSAVLDAGLAARAFQDRLEISHEAFGRLRGAHEVNLD